MRGTPAPTGPDTSGAGRHRGARARPGSARRRLLVTSAVVVSAVLVALLALRKQRLRMPRANGMPYRKGQGK
ncbi:hypothetical protein JTP67_30425 [Streptomyces sp. S12]|nr:hypothetical protein [Streptomyces sp. S12]